MKRPSRTRLFLEELESRLVPATVKLSGGSLTVNGPIHGAIILTQDPVSAAFNVTEGGVNLGTYKVTGNITIDTRTSLLPGGGSTVNVFLAQGQSLNGNLAITTGNGTDSVTVDTLFAGGAAPSVIRGSLSITGGNGSDAFNLGNVTGLTVGGLTSVTGGLGSSSLQIGNAGSFTTSLRGDVQVTNIEIFDLGLGNADTIGGNLVINDSAANLTDFFVLDTATTVSKSLTVLGGHGADVLVMDNTVNGATSVNLGAGLNEVGTGPDAVFLGSFTYSSPKSALDALSFDGSTFASNVTLITGNGNNLYGFNGLLVAGSLTLTAGNGDNALGDFTGVVGGNLSISVGSGTNSINFDGAGGTLVGGKVIYTSGNGDNTFEVSTGGSHLALNITFGTGSDVFTIDTAADEADLTGFLNWGDEIAGNDTFNEPMGGAFAPDWAFRGVQ